MIITNGRIIDPANKRDEISDILIKGSKIERVAKNIKAGKEETIDAKGKIVIPGIIDMHVHLREPGREDNETVLSGTKAAIAGGITSVCAMPNTYPIMDSIKTLNALNNIIKRDSSTNTYIISAITEERKGQKLVDIKGMKSKGIVAISDDGGSVQDNKIMQKALKKAREEDVLVISHCEDKTLSGKGVVNEGIVATKLGLRPISRKSEYAFVERDIDLAKKYKARLHIAHVSCKESVDIIRKAKKNGVNVTAEATPHHFNLTDTCCETYDTRTKMSPPLRSKSDVDAIKEALKDGTIDIIASDHAPHGKHEKEIVFERAAFGIIGLETSLALSIMALVDTKKISWNRLVELISLNPARILNLKKKGRLSPGCDADITIIDPNKRWTYKKETIVSKSKNSPFIDWQFKGKAVAAIVGGKRIDV